MGLRQLIVLAIFFGAVPEAFAAERQPGVFKGRVIDVSLSAARALGIMQAGVVRVSVE